MYLLNIKGIGNLNSYLLSISIITFLFYFKFKKIIYLLIAAILFSFSIVRLIDQFIFLVISIRLFIYLLVVALVLILVYLRTRTKNYLLFGNILLALSLNSLFRQLVEIKGLVFFLISLSFYISYLETYRNHRIIWPKYLAVVFFLMGFVALL